VTAARRRALAAAGLCLALAGVVAACGKKAPPVAPERRLPLPPSDLKASVEERTVTVSWQNPRARVDNTRMRDLAVVHLWRREEAPGAPPKPAMLSGDRVVGYDEVARIPLDQPPPGVQVQGGTMSVPDAKGLAFGKRYIYVATAEDSTQRSSAPSQRLEVAFLAAPEAPQGLRAEPGDREVSLRWQPPAAFLDGAPASGEIRYTILRGGEDGPLTAVTTAPVAGTTYTATGLANDTAYRFAVQAVRVEGASAAKGPVSAAVAATPLNTRPPQPPGNLVAIPAGTSVRLGWNPSPAEDLAEYAIYRAAGEGEFARIGTTPPITTLYTDRDVQAGTRYRYAVTAINRARTANESERSNVVTVTAE